MPRSVKKGAFVDGHLAEKIASAGAAQSKKVIKTTLATYYAHHAQGTWFDAPTVTIEPTALELPSAVAVDQAMVLFPFAHASRKLADPQDALWTKWIVARSDGPPPVGLAGSVEAASERWPRLLPPGAWEVLESHVPGTLTGVTELTRLTALHPKNALLLRIAVRFASHLDDDYASAAALARRLVEAFPTEASKFGLADILACIDTDEAHRDAETLFRKVLANNR